MQKVTIKGGNKLKGIVVPIPNKNFLVSVLPAAILTDEDVVFHQVPDTTDIQKIIQIYKKLGVSVDVSENSKDKLVKINCKGMKSYKVDKNLGSQFRASIVFAGPLLARFGKAEVPVPGGCTLGRRAIHAHVEAFRKMGIKVEYFDGYVRFTAPKKVKNTYDFWIREASVTATANLAMYAAGTPTSVSVIGVACEPHVIDILRTLSKMGAGIRGIGSNKISIKGSDNLHGVDVFPRPDFVDIGGYIVAAAITDGEIRIKDANISYIVDGLIDWFEMFNISVTRDKKDLVVKRGRGGLFIDPLNFGFPLAEDDLPKFIPRPWPGFPTDVFPIIPTLASKMDGKILLHNWMWERSLAHAPLLQKLGANIDIIDDQKIIVHGPVNFVGGNVTAPDVIQGCKALFLAGLCDPVETTIKNVEILERRYPNIFEVYRNLGAEIS